MHLSGGYYETIMRFFLQVIVALFLSNLCAAQRIQVDYSPVNLMYNVLGTMKAGAERTEISRLMTQFSIPSRIR